MRIGLLSDSHGRSAITQRAVDLLAGRGVELLLHLGDVGGAEVIDALLTGHDAQGRLVPAVRVVFGNTDYDWPILSRYAQPLGVAVDHPMGQIDLGDGRTLMFTHGDRDDLVRQAMQRRATYLCHGHTHCRRDERLDQTRVINPGALHRAAVYSAAVLDTAADRVDFLEVR
jgi:hypothetical protein